MKRLLHIINQYRKWRGDWDGLCGRCGLCCYTRTLADGEVVVNLSAPCIYLDEGTRLCRVFKVRYQKYEHCGSVNLLRALFSPTLPPSCAYYRTFRAWK